VKDQSKGRARGASTGKSPLFVSAAEQPFERGAAGFSAGPSGRPRR
jgi:hypothetical protein